MTIPVYLAMTAEEMAAAPLPPHLAWMACHFSPYSTGLVNLPEDLPKGSLLILNDRTPIHGHKPEQVCEELALVIETFSCCGLLLDFQNHSCAEAAELVQYLSNNLPCKIGIPAEYQSENAAVFLPPIPTDILPKDYLAPWKGHEIWLEMSSEGQTLSLTSNGTTALPNRVTSFPSAHIDPELHCHYHIASGSQSVSFHTWRTGKDIVSMLDKAEKYGIAKAIGLYQELMPEFEQFVDDGTNL